MKIDIERLETCELALTIEVEPERLEAAKRASARRLSEKHNIPGFRKGKAPYAIVVRQFGEKAIVEDAVEQLGPKLYEEALDAHQIDPYAPGNLTELKLDPPVFKFTVPLKPEVDLGDYRSIRLPYAVPEVSDEAVNENLEHLREHHAVLEPVERPAQPGDVVTVDVMGELTGAAGSQFLLDDKAVSVLIDPKVEWPVPGFAEKLAGLSAGEERTIELSFPDDYGNEDLRGKAARFTVTASDVKSRTLLEWNDDFAKEVGSYETLLDLRAQVRQELQERAERGYAVEYAQSVQDIAVAAATVKFPPILLDREIVNLEDDLDRRLREQNLNLEDYLKLQKKSHDTLHEELRPRAAERLKRGLVLGKIVEVEGLEVETGEVEAQIERMTGLLGDESKRLKTMLNSKEGKRSIAVDLLTDRAVARLMAIAKGEAPEIPNPDTQSPNASRPTEEATPAAAAEAAETTPAPQPAAQAASLPELGGAG